MAAACMASDFLWRTVAAESSWWLPEQIRLSTYKVGPAMFNQVLFDFFCVNSILDCFYSMRTTQGVCAHQLDVTYKFCRLAVCSFGSFKNLMWGILCASDRHRLVWYVQSVCCGHRQVWAILRRSVWIYVIILLVCVHHRVAHNFAELKGISQNSAKFCKNVANKLHCGFVPNWGSTMPWPTSYMRWSACLLWTLGWDAAGWRKISSGTWWISLIVWAAKHRKCEL